MEISTETPPNVANVWSDARPEIERGRDRVRHEFRCEVLQVNHPPSLVRRRHSGAGGRGRRTDNQRGRRSRRRLPHQRSRLCPPLQHSRPSLHSALLSSPLSMQSTDATPPQLRCTSTKVDKIRRIIENEEAETRVQT